MYFVNPFYEPPILTSSEKHQKTKQVCEILSLSKHQRTALDKRKVYQYFIAHPLLRQIQRSKSLRARILCVAEIQLISQTRYAEDFHKNQTYQSQPKKFQALNALNTTQKYVVLQKFVSTETLAVLDSSIISQILAQDQEPLKHKMNELKKFSFLKQFEYHELLYLSHFVQKTKGFAYKQFVFKQEEPANCVYFIEEGEFQVFKNIKSLKQKSQTRINQKKQMTPFQKYLEKQESPYKVKQFRLKREEVSKIEGGCGQSFGQLELFLQSQVRLNSFRCNSLTSKLYQIPFSAFQEVFQNLQTKFKNLKKQYLAKNEQSTYKVRKIKSLKQNGINKAQTLFELDSTIQNKKLSGMIFEMDKYKQLQSQHLEGSFTLPNNSLTIPINEFGQDKNLKRSIKHYTPNSMNRRYDQGHFSSLSNATKDFSKSIDLKVSSFDTPFFPVIKKSHTQNKEEKKETSPLVYSVAKRRNKIKGLMDISSIIKEKEDLYNSLSGVQNPEFSFYKLDQKNTKRINYKMAQLNKVQLKVSSPAHSENFMQDLVKQSLKKSGYIQESSLKSCQTKRTLEDMSRLKTIEKVSSFSLYNEKENQLQIGCKQPEELNFVLTKEFRASLVSNEFDNFFNKF